MKKNCRVLMIAAAALMVMTVMGTGLCAFAETDPGWKPTENQDKFEGMDYGLGMFSAAARGTDITVNSDGTVTLNVTTKPMVSTKYAKVAFSQEELTDDAKKEAAAAGIAVTVGTAEDSYIGQFDGIDYGIKPYYWSEFSYTMPVESLEKPVYTAGYNVLTLKNKEDKIYEEDLTKGKWAYSSTWTINPTQELIQKLRSKQAELGESDTAARIGKVADHLEAQYPEYIADKAREAIAAAKADLTDKALIEEALAACEKLSDAQKAELADDIKTLEDAKAEIERKENEAKEIAKVQAGKISGFKAKAGKKMVTFTWKKNTVFAGYQLKYKVGGKSKTVTISSAKTVKKVVKKLKKGKKVTAQIRGYKKIAGKTYYGKKWASAKAVKVK